jgi:hypothetical protein
LAVSLERLVVAKAAAERLGFLATPWWRSVYSARLTWACQIVVQRGRAGTIMTTTATTETGTGMIADGNAAFLSFPALGNAPTPTTRSAAFS